VKEIRMKPYRRPHLVFPLLLCVLVAACAKKPLDNRQNLVLITVDTLRSDHLGCYGYWRDTSPFLDQLAQEGILFKNAIVQWPKTQPSLASMLTSIYPSDETTIHTSYHGLPESFTLCSEILMNEGFQTLAIVSNYNVGKSFNYDQGFAVFVESWMDEYLRKTGEKTFRNKPGYVKDFTNATIVTDQAIDLLKKHSSKGKFFLWIHYMDPHGPYVPPKKYEEYFSDWTPGGALPVQDIPPYQRQLKSGAEQVITDPEFYKAQYDREIRFWDDELKRLVSYMKKKGLTENSVIALTADHGESLDEHDYFFEHGNQPYEPCYQVPLLIIAPKLKEEAGKTVVQPVPLIDLLPTLLDLLDVSWPPGLQGNTLLPLLSLEQPEDRVIFGMAGPGIPYQRVLRLGDWKLIQVPSEKDRLSMTGLEYELYNLKDDPGEKTNLVDAFPDKADSLKKMLLNWRPTVGEMPLQAEKPVQHDEFSKEMLESLGYLK
jgi:arylsulfatase A-like enzyme